MEQGKVLECKAYWEEAGKLFSSLPIGTPEILGSVETVPAALEGLKVSSVCVVTDKGIRAAGLLEGLQAALENAGIAVAVYDGVVPNPTVSNVEAARRSISPTGATASSPWAVARSWTAPRSWPPEWPPRRPP